MQKFLKKIIVEAGEIAEGYFRTGVQHAREKASKDDLVTEADEAVSNFLIEQIQRQYPDHAILSEERAETINPNGEYEWVIDPIDGARNFVAGIAFWCISIAVVQRGQQYLGALYNPLSKELFFAEKGKGAFLNDKQIFVNNTQSIDAAVGVFVLANSMGNYGDYIDRFHRACIGMINETKMWMLNYGCIWGQCFVASGGIDFSIGNAGMDWDFLAGFLICEEAGAVVTDSDGSPWQRGRQDYIIANPDLHPKLLAFFKAGQTFQVVSV